MHGDPSRGAAGAPRDARQDGHGSKVPLASVTPAPARAFRARVRRALGLIVHPNRIRARLEVAADARRFDQANSFLKGDTRGSGPVALAVSLTAWPYLLKLEGMLLKALELEGLRPLVLTSSALPRGAARYHRTFGFESAELERFAPADSLSGSVERRPRCSREI